MNLKDTSQEAQRVQVEIYRRMTTAEKVRCIFDAYNTGRVLAMAGLRERYPGASEKKIRQMWAQEHLGKELFQQVYGEMPDE
jgi:hypothetical protein